MFAMSAMPGPFRLSVDDYHKMIDHGILTDRDKVELIHGELLEKFPKTTKHVACSIRRNQSFAITSRRPLHLKHHTQSFCLTASQSLMWPY